MIHVHITDDHKIVTKSLSKVINDSDYVQVTSVSHTLESCREELAKQLPDVLLLDIEMPDGDGVDFCAEITKTYPSLKIIMLTVTKEFNIAKYALKKGAHGYIIKNADPDEVFAGIETVCNGKQFLCEEIAVLLQDRKESDTIWLTDVERRILKLCAEGFTRRQIAVKICRTEETVKSHIRNIRLKLNAKNITQAVKIAFILKLI
jgi:DNA-binding NarL/FixJ family response regulator